MINPIQRPSQLSNQIASQFSRSDDGFTLIEVLIAISIFAMLMIFSIQGFLLVANMEERNRESLAVEQNFHRAWSLIGQDFLHLRSRPIKDQFGTEQGAYIAGREPYLVEFTRGGLPSLPTSPGGMMRVAYHLSDEGELIRTTWSALDTLDIEDLQEQVIISGLEEVSFEQLNNDNYFEEIWPPLNQQESAVNSMPRMIQVSLRTADGIELSRLIPGIATPAAGGNGARGQNAGGAGDGSDDNSASGI